MDKTFFWLSWSKSERNLYQALLGVFVAAVFFYFGAYIEGVDQILAWDEVISKKWIQYPIDYISYGYTTIPITVDVPLLFGVFEGSGLQLNTALPVGFLVLIAVAVSLSLAVISTLDRTWYIGGMVLFILFVVGFRLENLLLFNSVQKWPTIILLGLTIPISYYFNEINRNPGLMLRTVVFALVLSSFGCLVTFYSGVEAPALYIANYGYFGFIGIFVLFLLTISHEIINGFLYLTTRSSNPNSARDFSIISGLYLVNLFLVYLNKIEVIAWSFSFANVYILLLVSTLIGIWGISLRSNLLDDIIPFKPGGALLYLCLAIISFASIGYFLSMGNDPVLSVVEDLILYSHIGFGLIFFIYILSNFSQPLSRGYAVYKIVYDPKVMPYFTFRLAGIITVLALLLQANYKTYVYKSLSGYYNGIGDLYHYVGDRVSARAYYKEGSDFGYLNHRSNYLLGKMYEEDRDFPLAEEFLVKSIQRKPTPYAFVNLATLYLDKDKPYDAIFMLEEGLKEFPSDGVLANNMGMAMNEVGVLDSALIYLFESIGDKNSSEIALTNSLGLVMDNGLSLNYDSLIADQDSEISMTLGSNLLLLQGVDTTLQITEIDCVLTASTSAYLYNHLISLPRPLDSAEHRWLDSVKLNPNNYRYENTLNSGLSINLFRNGDINQAIHLQDYAANNAFSNRSSYFRRLALWCMKYGGYERAEKYLNEAIKSGDRDALMYKSICLLELGEIREATQLLSLLSASGDYPLATEIITAINVDEKGIDSLESSLLYYKGKYGLDPESEEEMTEALKIIPEGVRALILAEEGRKALMHGDLEQANELLNSLDGLRITGARAINEALQLEIDILVERSELEAAGIKLEQWLSMGGKDPVEMAYYDWMIRDRQPDESTIFLIGSNPYRPHYVGKAIGALNESGSEQVAYRLILENLEIAPELPGLQEIFIYQCARLGYTNYAESALKDLARLVDEERLTRIRNNYEILLARFEKDWEFEDL